MVSVLVYLVYLVSWMSSVSLMVWSKHEKQKENQILPSVPWLYTLSAPRLSSSKPSSYGDFRDAVMSLLAGPVVSPHRM